LRKTKPAKNPSDGGECEARAYKFLGFRALSKKELGLKLALAGFEPETVEKALAKLARLRYLDDEQLALDVAQAELEAGRRGIRGIGEKLAQRGITRESVAKAVASLSAESEKKAALQLARKKAAKEAGTASPKVRQGIYGLLVRKGFSGPAIRYAMREVTGDWEAEG
jgi:regulatory protein